uniref:Phosphatidylinositol-3,4,5-trisphosphate 3-phosphatase n=1 Tax=Peronospora matthiolae TaxID=2874970 RepID=A0AAV1UPR0_9STRA
MASRFSGCRQVLAVPRSLVSQNKRRFRQDGFDLDLGYVHPRVIVMGYPATGVELLFRNSREEVQSFLEERHAGDYFVFNFCDEPKRSYSPITFDGRVKRFPIEDHNVPSFQTMVAFCEEAAAWLAGSKKHVVVLHCKAGKGRAGMMACMLLLRMGYVATATEAIECYNSERVRDHRGLTVASQTKWVAYYAASRVRVSVFRDISRAEPTVTVHKLTLNNTLTAKKLPKLRLRIFTLAPNGLSKTLIHQKIGFHEFELCQEIRGCVMIEFRREQMNGCMRAKHFKIWFNTHFLKPDARTGRVTFPRSEMDWASQDKKYHRLPAAFELSMTISK